MRDTGRKWLLAVIACVCLLAAPPVRADDPVLEIAVFPHLSVHTLMERYRPLREYLESSLKRPVSLITAPDFRSFVEQTQARHYAFVITAPHFARLAQLKAGYRPLLQPVNPLHGIFLVPAESAVKKLADLKGRTVATPDSLAVVTAMGEAALKTAGLKVPGDVAFLNLPSHNAAILAVQHKQADAALASHYMFLQMKPEEKDQLRAIGQTAEMPAPFIFMAGPAMPEAESRAIKAAILDFAQKTEAGKAFMESTHFQALEVPGEADMSQIDPYLPALERALNAKP